MDCNSQRGWTLTAVTQEKHLLFLWFDLFWDHKELDRTEQLSTVDSFDFSFFPPSIVVVNFIGTMKSN